MSELSAEDQKLITLARGARARVAASSGAAIRDEMGRTYSGATVSLASFTLSALQLAVAQAVAAGATGCECAVLINSEAEPTALDLAAVSDLGGPSVPVLVCKPDGSVAAELTSGDVA